MLIFLVAIIVANQSDGQTIQDTLLNFVLTETASGISLLMLLIANISIHSLLFCNVLMKRRDLLGRAEEQDELMVDHTSEVNDSPGEVTGEVTGEVSALQSFLKCYRTSLLDESVEEPDVTQYIISSSSQSIKNGSLKRYALLHDDSTWFYGEQTGDYSNPDGLELDPDVVYPNDDTPDG